MRIGLLGAGRIGQMHAQGLRSHDALDDTLIADPDTDAATHPLKEHRIIRLHEIPA